MIRTITFGCKLFVLVTTVSLSSYSVFAQSQCNAPAMVWENPVLVSGTAGEMGAVYKFPSVNPGVDAMVSLQWKVGGATLTSIDDNLYGYNAAWQPVVKTPNLVGETNSYIGFRIEFKNSSDGSNHVYPCFQLSFIDVDGDNQGVKEYVAAKNADSAIVSPGTALTLSWISGNLVQAIGPLTNFVNIDTSAYTTNINYRYSNTDKVNEVRVGNITLPSFTVQDRYSCGYFKQISMPAVSVLPVQYSSFDAFVTDNMVSLKWVTEQEINHNRYEIERSFDARNFSKIGTVTNADHAFGSTKTYRFTDTDASLQNAPVVYYRLKQIDNNGTGVYSTTIPVRMQAKKGITMQVSPNPFAEKLFVRFESTQKGNAELRIMNSAGQTVVVKQSAIVKGYNNLQLEGLTKLPMGMYISQVSVNGEMVDHQKLIRN